MVNVLSSSRNKLVVIVLLSVIVIYNIFGFWFTNINIIRFDTNYVEEDRDFGIILFGYSSRNTNQAVEYLEEANILCENLLFVNKIFVNITLFTNKGAYNQFIGKQHERNQSVCIFDKILYVEDILNISLSSSSTNKRDFQTRTKLYKYSPYRVTMALDSDIRACSSLNIPQLYKEMITKNIDFAFVTWKINRFPQGGLMLYQQNNKTKYLLDQWSKYQINNNMNDDQGPLHQVLKDMLNTSVGISVHLLNPKYNLRVFGQEFWNVGAVNYAFNDVIMFHCRDAAKLFPIHDMCMDLNNYSNISHLSFMTEGNKGVGHCFGPNDGLQPKCIDKMHLINEIPRMKKHFDFIWSLDHKCQWNNDINFVEYNHDKCSNLSEP
eukprot:81574_1